MKRNIVISILQAVGLLLGLTLNLAAVEPLDNWQWRNPLPQGNRLSAITYGGGLVVGVGEFGSIITSPDLATTPWGVSHSPTNGDLSAVTYANGLYVAGGAGGGTSGMILTSTDATNWFKQSWTNNNTRAIYGLAYGAGLFVAVGERSGVWSSPDGTNWTRQLFDDSSSRHLQGITYKEGLGFVAVGSSGKVLTSLDGITWATNTPPITTTLNAITYGTNGLGEGIFMAVGSSGAILTSPDASNWTLQNSMTTVSLKGVAYSPGVGFSAVGSASSISWVTASPDAVNWTAAIPSVGNEDYRAVTYAPGMFVAVGHYGGTISSSTGMPASWVSRTAYGWTDYSNGGAWSGTNFVVANLGGSVVTSPDGITWTYRATGATTANLRCIAYGAGRFVAGGDAGTILTSEDEGTNWAAQSSPVATTLNGLAYVNNTFVAVGASGVILTSPDGTNWTQQTSFASVTLRGAAYGAGLYVVVGDSGTVRTSADGITWDPQVFPDTRAINGIIYAMDTFVVVGERNRVLTSTDGTNWISILSGGSSDPTFNGIAYGSGTLVVAGGSAAILSSPDGTNWTKRVTINAISQRFIVYGANSFVVGGSGGVTVQALAALPTIIPTYDSGTLTLTWTGGGTLQAAPEVTGTYTNIPGASSPFSLTPLTEPRLFFRVRML